MVAAMAMAAIMVLTVGVMADPRKVVIHLRGAIHPPEGTTVLSTMWHLPGSGKVQSMRCKFAGWGKVLRQMRQGNSVTNVQLG